MVTHLMLRRLLGLLRVALPLLLLLTMLSFGLQALTPGDPARLLLLSSGQTDISDAARNKKAQELGLDRPLAIRYLDWCVAVLRGNLGRSFKSGEPVANLLASRALATAALAATTIVVAVIIALPAGMFAGLRPGHPVAHFITGVSLLGIVTPGFWLAFVLMIIFAQHLRWLPVFGSLTSRGIIMPALALAIPFSCFLIRTLKQEMLETRKQEFVTVCRAKGLSERRILAIHLLPHALAAIVTLIGLELASLLSGAIIIEQVFAWPGLGTLVIDSVLAADTPVVSGFVLVASLAVMIIGIGIDFVHAMIDPRLRGRHDA